MQTQPRQLPLVVVIIDSEASYAHVMVAVVKINTYWHLTGNYSGRGTSDHAPHPKKKPPARIIKKPEKLKISWPCASHVQQRPWHAKGSKSKQLGLFQIGAHLRFCGPSVQHCDLYDRESLTHIKTPDLS